MVSVRGIRIGSATQPARTAPGTTALSIADIPFDSLVAEDMDCWRELEEHALEPNIYLSLDYVQALFRHTSMLSGLRVLVVKQAERGSYRFAAVMPVIPVPPSRNFPFWHLTTLSSPYTLLSGLLLDRREPYPAALCLFQYLRRSRWKYFGVRMPHLVEDSEQSAILMSAARETSCHWREDIRKARASLAGLDRPDRDWLDAIPTKQRKTIYRRRKQLAQTGRLDWRYISSPEITDDQILRFLELEHSGWKGTHGTSILANRQHETFFLELVRTLRNKGRIFLTELRLDDRAIAITVNFRLGKSAFAFKTGWHPDYASYGIGILNEVAFLENIEASRGWGLANMDSGAETGTYMDALWPDRSVLLNGMFITNNVGQFFSYPLRVYRQLKAVTP